MTRLAVRALLHPPNWNASGDKALVHSAWHGRGLRPWPSQALSASVPGPADVTRGSRPSRSYRPTSGDGPAPHAPCHAMIPSPGSARLGSGDRSSPLVWMSRTVTPCLALCLGRGPGARRMTQVPPRLVHHAFRPSPPGAWFHALVQPIAAGAPKSLPIDRWVHPRPGGRAQACPTAGGLRNGGGRPSRSCTALCLPPT